MFSCDVLIVGGGPSGAYAGISIIKNLKTCDTIILEQRKISGIPPHCAGLIGISGLSNLKLDKVIEKQTDINRITSAKFISPSGISLTINRKRNELVVLDRPKLDFFLAKKAQELGTRFYFQHRATNITKLPYKEGYLVSGLTKNKDTFRIKAKVIISAEGHHPHLTPQVGLPIPSYNWLFPALQYEMNNVTDIDLFTVELYFGQKIAPGFFAWLIPVNNDQVRVGLAVHPLIGSNVRKRLDSLISKHPILAPKLKRGKILSSWGGFVPTSGPVYKTYTHGFLVIGDAAGQTKATTGGGFNISSFCGYLAGRTAAKAIFHNDNSSSMMKEYQRAWKSHFEPDLSFMKLIRRTISFLPDPIMDNLFLIARETDLEKTMLDVPNIDLHGKETIKYTLNPITIKKGLKISPYLFKSFLRGILV